MKQAFLFIVVVWAFASCQKPASEANRSTFYWQWPADGHQHLLHAVERSDGGYTLVYMNDSAQNGEFQAHSLQLSAGLEFQDVQTLPLFSHNQQPFVQEAPDGSILAYGEVKETPFRYAHGFVLFDQQGALQGAPTGVEERFVPIVDPMPERYRFAFGPDNAILKSHSEGWTSFAWNGLTTQRFFTSDSVNRPSFYCRANVFGTTMMRGACYRLESRRKDSFHLWYWGELAKGDFNTWDAYPGSRFVVYSLAIRYQAWNDQITVLALDTPQTRGSFQCQLARPDASMVFALADFQWDEENRLYLRSGQETQNGYCQILCYGPDQQLRWNRSFDLGGSVRIRSMHNLSNGDFIAVGSVTDGGVSHMLALRFTAEGQLRWSKTFAGRMSASLNWCREMRNGDCLLGGSSLAFGQGLQGSDLVLLRINEKGEWQ